MANIPIINDSSQRRMVNAFHPEQDYTANDINAAFESGIITQEEFDQYFSSGTLPNDFYNRVQYGAHYGDTNIDNYYNVEQNGGKAPKLSNAGVANMQTEEWLTDAAAQLNDYFNRVTEFNQTSADKAYERSRQEARELRQWQERMSNTQYQRAVADMKKAGLNPMLLATRGFSGASTPQGAMGSASSSSIGLPGVPYTSAVKDDNAVKSSSIAALGSVLSALIGLIKYLPKA